MTKDDITRMAQEADLLVTADLPEDSPFVADIARFAHLVYEATFRDANIAASKTILDAAVLEEREACAKVCEELPYECCWPEWALSVAEEFAATIRARSKV
jgi:hypothetical protein